MKIFCQQKPLKDKKNKKKCSRKKKRSSGFISKHSSCTQTSTAETTSEFTQITKITYIIIMFIIEDLMLKSNSRRSSFTGVKAPQQCKSTTITALLTKVKHWFFHALVHFNILGDLKVQKYKCSALEVCVSKAHIHTNYQATCDINITVSTSGNFVRIILKWFKRWKFGFKVLL